MVTFLAAAIVSRQMYGNSDDKIRDQIQSTYDGYAKSVLNHDLDGTMNFLTSDIVWVYPGGKEQHRDEIRDGLKQWEDSITPGTKMHFTIEKLKIDSDSQVEAYVTLHYLSPEMKAANKAERTSKWHDTWLLSPHGNWQNVRGEALGQSKG